MLAGPLSGSRNQSGATMSSRMTPSTSHRPAMIPSAARTSRAAASGGTASRAPAGRDVPKLGVFVTGFGVTPSAPAAAGKYLPGPPGSLPEQVGGSPHDLLRRHALQAPHVPLQPRLVARPGLRLGLWRRGGPACRSGRRSGWLSGWLGGLKPHGAYPQAGRRACVPAGCRRPPGSAAPGGSRRACPRSAPARGAHGLPPGLVVQQLDPADGPSPRRRSA